MNSPLKWLKSLHAANRSLHPLYFRHRHPGGAQWCRRTQCAVLLDGAAVVVALVTGVGEVAAGAVTLTEFVIAGVEALAARYGARALASFAF